MRTNSADDSDAITGAAARREAYDRDSEFGLPVGLPHAGTTYQGHAATQSLQDSPPETSYVTLPQGY